MIQLTFLSLFNNNVKFFIHFRNLHNIHKLKTTLYSLKMEQSKMEKHFFYFVSFNIRLKSRLKNDLSEYMQKQGISKIRIRVVHAKRIIFSCAFLFKKRCTQGGVFKFIII